MTEHLFPVIVAIIKAGFHSATRVRRRALDGETILVGGYITLNRTELTD